MYRSLARLSSFPCLLIIVLVLASFGKAAQIIDADVCVYGSTSGGVSAAVAASRLGKSVVLVGINNHLGGMSSGGLGVTDRGNINSIGGIAREFYTRVAQHYNTSGQAYFFEPHIAEQTFNEMLTGAGVPFYTNQRLSSVTITNQRLASIITEDGSVFRAKMFIDTTYEGDLIAAAGVSYTFGREAKTTYNESLAGVQTPGGSYNYDPYVTPGNPASGLLPLVQAGSAGIAGNGDQRIQAYNFRLCLTQNATNQIPITAPANYSESQYELVARYLTARVASDGAVQLNQLIDVQTIIPNGKTDINANGEVSTDYVGASYTWPTNTYSQRDVVRQQHEDYIRGLLYFFANSSRVPLNVRTQMQSWQLAKDEFIDTGGWPHQIYVREGRRMVSDYVMTQSNAESRVVAPDPICLASYNIDSHGVSRVVSGGFSRWEGSIGGTPPYPYPISYHSIIPRTGECQNVFSTFALSASHVAFASCRMEPVFMMTSQSAGTAAAFAIDDNVPVQSLNYAKLNAQLRADGQILSWTSATTSTNGIILDQGGPGTTYTSGWSQGANAGGWNGDYWHDGSTGKGTKWVKYTPTLPTNGTYDVYIWWVEASNRATNTPVDVIHPAGTNRFLINQILSSGGWKKLLTTNFNAGTNGSVIVRNDNTLAGTYCIADGVRFLPVGDIAITNQPLPAIDVVASDAVAGEFNTNIARFAFVRSGDTNDGFPINFTLSGTATNGADYNFLPGTITLATGATATNLVIIPIRDSVSEGPRTITVTVLPSTNYTLGSLTSATTTLLDLPIDDWRFAHFSASERNNPAISGDLADPDHNGLSNLMEYALGFTKTVPETTPRPFAQIQNGYLTYTYTRSKAAIDVTLTLEQSSDLLVWQPAQTQQQSFADDGKLQTITDRLNNPISAASAFYLRLKVTRL